MIEARRQVIEHCLYGEDINEMAKLSLRLVSMDMGGALAGTGRRRCSGPCPGVQLWHWPPWVRAETRSKMHAKVVVADRRALLVSSANLTESGVAQNLEAGLLVHGGHAPRRAAEHVDRLIAAGAIARLHVMTER